MSTKIHQKCPREFTNSGQEKSPILSTKIHLLCPWEVCHPQFLAEQLTRGTLSLHPVLQTPLDFQTLRRPYIFFVIIPRIKVTIWHLVMYKKVRVNLLLTLIARVFLLCVFASLWRRVLWFCFFFAMLLSRTRPPLYQNVKNATLGKSGIAGLT